MKKINVQFHATSEDFAKLVNRVNNDGYKVYGIQSYPSFRISHLDKVVEREDIRECEMIVISRNVIEPKENRVDFLKNLDNKLGITIGKETEEKLLESSMWVWAEREIDSDLRRIINSFKKIMNRGAWVIGPNDSSKNTIRITCIQTMLKQPMKMVY